MVVEDEPDIYEVLLAMFEMWGIEGVAFVDGEEAVSWIDDVDNGHYQGELPELALLDVRLPGELEGYDVGNRLRKSPFLGNIAIVLTTAYKVTPEEYEKFMEKSGADKWLPKPLPRFNELQGILEDVIAKRRAKSTTSKAVASPNASPNTSENTSADKSNSKPETSKTNESTKKSTSASDKKDAH
jgi:CheY-like chemotaxis protein